MSEQHWDVIVLGGGTMGTAAAWALSARGVRTLVLEQFEHIHAMGSHGGGTRMFRHAYAEDPAYVPLMQRADDLWCGLQEETGTEIVHRVGVLEMDAPGFDHAKRAKVAADEHNIEFEWIDSDEVRKRWPAFSPPENWDIGWNPIAGFLDVDAALSGLAAIARRDPVILRTNEPVLEWSSNPTGVEIRTATNTYRADKLVVAAGAWSGAILADLGLPLEVARKVLFWFDVEPAAHFRPDAMPAFLTASSYGEIYGFPIYHRSGIKMADHQGGQPTTADTIDRTATDDEGSNCVQLSTLAMRGVTDRVLHKAVCMYTRTPDTHFIVDRHPGAPNVVLAAGFSGHGFKFAPAIGEQLADLALDPSARPFDLFRIDRFGG